MRPYPLLISLLSLATVTASAEILVFDDFGPVTDPTTNLNTRTPVTGPNNWAGYSGGADSGWKVSGGAALFGSSSSGNGMAGIELGANYFSANPGIYELTVHYTLDAVSDTTWIGFGFAQEFDTAVNRGLYTPSPNPTEGLPWAFMRNNGEINVRSGGGSDTDLISQSGFDVTDFEFKLVLDTSVAMWTVDAFYGDTQLDLNGGNVGNTFTYGTNPTSIGWVGLSASTGASGTIQSITLESVPEPETYSLILGAAALAGLLMRRRN